MTYDKFYVLGMNCAIVIGVLGIAYLVRKKMGFMNVEYDERQKIIQGIGYKYGFFTMMISCMLYGMATGFCVVPVHPTVMILACVFLGVGVFGGYCIWKEAYFGIHANNKSTIVVMVLVVAANALSTVSHMISGTIMEDGVIGINALNVLCAIFFLAMLSVIAVKSWTISKADGGSKEEDE